MHDEITESNCRRCGRSTRHAVLFEVSHDAEEEHFSEKHTWQVLRCLGCETVGFRYQFDDYDDVIELPDGETKHGIKHHRYPYAIAGHRELGFLWVVPDLISKVYRQSVTAFAGDARILAGIGLRATIEAVCNELKVSGSSLEKRIDALAKGGYISTSDKRRLHAIRFLGNDAAHEIREPKIADLRVALEIVEHLINTVYILEYKSKNLDVQVDTYEQFLKLLHVCALRNNAQTPLSLAAILGQHKRRVATDLSTYETQVSGDIGSGAIKYLVLDSLQQVEGKDVQLYRIERDKLHDVDDIPF